MNEQNTPALQPWSPTRVDQMRLNALQLAVQTSSSPNKVKLATAYFEFLNQPYEVEEELPALPTKGKHKSEKAA